MLFLKLVNNIKKLINLFIILSSIISFSTIIFKYNTLSSGYENLYLFPLFYSIPSIFLVTNYLNRGFNFTLLGILIMQGIRFVFLPSLLALSNGKEGFNYINPSSANINLSIYLMIFELCITYVFASVFFSYFLNKDKQLVDKTPTTLRGNIFIYIIFILISFVVLIYVGIPRGIVRFFYISLESSDGRIGDNVETESVLYQYIITSGAFLLFILIAWYMYVLNERKPNIVYYFITLFIALMNVSIIVGERRSAQIYIAIVTTYILMLLYPKYKKITVFSICSITGIILLFMSIYKFFGAFTTGSYLNAIQYSNQDVAFWARTFQSYYFGPENIASVIEFANRKHLGNNQFIYDNIRSIFGINFFVDKSNYITSQLYNLDLYRGQQMTGHVISAVGYGYIYFGIIFSSTVACLNIFISILIEYFTKITNKIEYKFLLSYILLRFCTNLYVNSPALITFSTIFLGTTGLIVVFSSIFTINSIRRDKI